MAEPLSIAAGAVGLLIAFTRMTIIVNDIAGDFKEAKNDIDSFVREVTELVTIVAQFQDERMSKSLPQELSSKLGAVLDSCSQVAVQAETHLTKSAARNLRGVYWSMTGRKEWLSLARSLEARKGTIVIALHLGTVMTTKNIYDNTEQILREIRDARHGPQVQEDVMLQRFLDDSETYAESVIDRMSVAHDTEPDLRSHQSLRQSPLPPSRLAQVVTPPLDSAPTQLPSPNPPDRRRRPSRHTSGQSGRSVYSPSASGEVERRSVINPVAERTMRAADEKTLYSVIFSPSSEWIACSSDCVIRVWGVTSNKREKRSNAHGQHHVYALAFSPDGNLLLSGGGDGKLRFWTTPALSSVEKSIEMQAAVTAITYSEDGDRLACALRNGTIHLMDAKSRHVIHTFQGDDKLREPRPACLQISTTKLLVTNWVEDSKFLATAKSTHWATVKIGDLSTGSFISYPHAVVANFSTCGKYLALAGMQHGFSLRVNDYRGPSGDSFYLSRKYENEACPRALVFSSDSQWIATGTVNGRLVFWHNDSNLDILQEIDFLRPITTLTASKDGKWLAVSGYRSESGLSSESEDLGCWIDLHQIQKW